MRQTARRSRPCRRATRSRIVQPDGCAPIRRRGLPPRGHLDQPRSAEEYSSTIGIDDLRHVFRPLFLSSSAKADRSMISAPSIQFHRIAAGCRKTYDLIATDISVSACPGAAATMQIAVTTGGHHRGQASISEDAGVGVRRHREGAADRWPISPAAKSSSCCTRWKTGCGSVSAPTTPTARPRPSASPCRSSSAPSRSARRSGATTRSSRTGTSSCCARSCRTAASGGSIRRARSPTCGRRRN